MKVIGQPPDEALLQMEGAIETHFNAVFRPDSKIGVHDLLVPEDDDDENTIHDLAFDPHKELYDSEKLIVMGQIGDGDKTITLTDVPIFYENRVNLFGLAHLGGDIALVTTAEFHEDGEWTDRSSDWIRKEAIKVMGQMLGAEWCDTEGCVMSYSSNPSDLTKLDEYICPDCHEVIGDEFLR